jgi:deoxyribonuclease V
MPENAQPLQSSLAGRVEPRDRFSTPLATVAGLCVGFDAHGAVACGSAVLLDATSLVMLAGRVAQVSASTLPADAPRSFLELPALLAALAALPHVPDLALVAGHGVAHPEGLGLAAHFGVATGLPTIGVADSILVGSGPEPHQTRGAYTALRDHGRRQLGWLLRSKPGCPPLVVSPGHRVALASAADLVMRYTRNHRLPEPLRLASELTSKS